MKISEEYITDNPEVIEITDARFIGDYAIRISFSDGLYKLVDFKPFLEKSLHPMIRSYLSEEKFKSFKIVDGNLNWNDYDLIFPLEDLYEGTL
jgi:hypothetical protein